MRVGVCCRVQDAGALPHECDFIEERAVRALVPMEPRRAFAVQKTLLRAARVPVQALNSFLPPETRCVGPEVDRERLRIYAERCLRRAAEVGVSVLVFGSGRSRTLGEGVTRESVLPSFVALLRQLGDSARANGVTLALEPLNRDECDFVNTLAEAAEIVHAADTPGLGLTADLYHMLREGEGPEAIVHHGARIAHVHVAEPAGRTAPGVEGTDFRPFLAALAEIGYSNDLSLECRWTDLGGECPRAIAELRSQCADVGLGRV